MNFKIFKVDPCLYFQWYKDDLVICKSWSDDCFNVGDNPRVILAKQDIVNWFYFDETLNMDEYFWCNLDHDYHNKNFKFTQPVILQIFEYEFVFTSGKTQTITSPAVDTLINVNA